MLAACFALPILSRPAAAQPCPQCQQESQHCQSGRCCHPWGRKRCKCVHAKNICFPPHLEHYGFYPTCWHPWPFPLDVTYSHCPIRPILPAMHLEKKAEAPSKEEQGPDLEEVLPPPTPDQPQKNNQPPAKTKPVQAPAKTKPVAAPQSPRLPRFR
jgi:hypothetical protein